MGLFSRWTKEKGAPAPEGAGAEAPKAEVKEEKSSAETGRERVEQIGGALRDTWNKWSGKTVDAGKWLLGKAADLGYRAVGGAEKGIKKGVEITKTYASETRQEAGQLRDSALDWTQGAASELSMHFDAQMMNLNVWAQEKVQKYNEVRDAAKNDFDTAVMRLNSWAQEKVDAYNQLKKNVENAPADAKKAYEQLKGQIIGGITERFTLLREGAKADIRQARADIAQKKDSFLGWANKKRVELAGTAELRGEVAELKEALARQNRLIEQLVRMQGVKAEQPRGEEEDEGVVEYTKTESGA